MRDNAAKTIGLSGQSARNPHRDRKTSPSSDGTAVLQRKTPTFGSKQLTPARQAAAAGSLWHDGAAQLVKGCGLIATGWRAFDHHRKQEFVQKLHDERVLSRFEADLKTRSPKLTKLIAIGDVADDLVKPDVIQHFEPEYSTLYQASVLVKSAGVEKLKEVLRSQPGAITRDVLKRMNESLKNGASDNKRTGPAQTENLADGELEHELVICAPGEEGIKNLARALSDPDKVASAIASRHLIGKATPAVFMGKGREVAVLVEAMKVIGKKPARVLLTRRPESADISDADICLISDGGSEFGINVADVWKVERTPDELVVALFPTAEEKIIRLFVAEPEGEVPSVAA
jgi:hypothetical protein